MKLTLFISVLMVLGIAPVHAACTAPDVAVQIPNGLTATLDEMKAAQAAVKAANAAVSDYTACLQQEQNDKIAGGGDKTKIQKAYAKLNDEEVDKLQQVVDKFNAELRAYNGRGPG
jgi:outer membrane protein assembly factor BamD (BamD/ComL family)